MFVQVVNLFFLILCVKSCIVQGKDPSVNEVDYGLLRKFLNEQISLLKNNKYEGHTPLRRLFKKFNQSEDTLDVQETKEFFLGTMKCSRYSIEKRTPKFSEEGNNRFMNLVWTFDNEENVTVRIIIPINNKNVPLSKSAIPVEKRGELYFVVNCNIPRDKENLIQEIKSTKNIQPNFNKDFINTSGQFYKSHEILVEKRNLVKATETKFNVKNSVDNLNIIVLGKISKMDLRIPVNQETLSEWNENGQISDLMRSLKRMTETRGLKLNVRNPPVGEGCLRLIPEEGTNYHFIIATVFNDSTTENKNLFAEYENATDEITKKDAQEKNLDERKYKERSVEMIDDLAEMEAENSSSNKLFSKLVDLENHEDEARHWKIPEEEREKWMNSSNTLKLPKVVHVTPDDENSKELTQETSLESRFAFPEEQNNNEENSESLVKILVSPQLEDRSNHESLEMEDFTRDSTDNFFQRKLVSIDVSADSNLIVRSGAGIVRIVFDVKNNQLLESVFCYGAEGSPLKARSIYPSRPLLNEICHEVGPGQVVTVEVELFVPGGILDTINSVTLSVRVGIRKFKIVQKTVNLYIQNSNIRKVDDTRPSIRYFFNNNCGGRLREDKCSKSIWSVDITVQDVDSGLKSVTSSPSGLEPRADYIGGTTNQVTFIYYATCCHQTVDISAVDMYGNYNKRRIDVTEWDNLSDGEIWAIVMGVLFLILLIILIILLIVYCIKRTKSRDLPYTQRYGSGPPAQRPERTSF